MKVIEPGHIYELQWLDGKPLAARPLDDLDGHHVFENRLIFVNRENTPHGGTQTQEVLRALIDRTQHCDRCLRWDGNDKIIHHLRMALALHESRAIERKTEKGIIQPEHIATNIDGHFALSEKL